MKKSFFVTCTIFFLLNHLSALEYNYKSWLLTFKAAPELNIRTSKELLELFSEVLPNKTRWRYRTEIKDNELIGHLVFQIGKELNNVVENVIKPSKT